MNDTQRKKAAEVVAKMGEMFAEEAIRQASLIAATGVPEVERDALAWAVIKHAELTLREKLQDTAEGQAYLAAAGSR